MSTGASESRQSHRKVSTQSPETKTPPSSGVMSVELPKRSLNDPCSLQIQLSRNDPSDPYGNHSAGPCQGVAALFARRSDELECCREPCRFSPHRSLRFRRIRVERQRARCPHKTSLFPLRRKGQWAKRQGLRQVRSSRRLDIAGVAAWNRARRSLSAGRVGWQPRNGFHYALVRSKGARLAERLSLGILAPGEGAP